VQWCQPSPPKISSRAEGEERGAGSWTKELMVGGEKLMSPLVGGPSLNGTLLSFLFNLFSPLLRKHFFTETQ